MTPSKIIAWCLAHPDAAAAYAALVVALLRAVYALISRLVQPYPRLRAAVEAVAALGPDVARSALQLYRAITGRPVPSMDLDARDAELAALRARVVALAADRTTTAPPPPSGQRGSVTLGPLLVLAVVTVIVYGALLCGCPSWQRPACPTPGAYRCAGDLPEYCAPSRQWTTAGDEPCSRQGRACAIAPDGVAWCAPMDGGAR